MGVAAPTQRPSNFPTYLNGLMRQEILRLAELALLLAIAMATSTQSSGEVNHGYWLSTSFRGEGDGPHLAYRFNHRVSRVLSADFGRSAPLEEPPVPNFLSVWLGLSDRLLFVGLEVGSHSVVS